MRVLRFGLGRCPGARWGRRAVCLLVWSTIGAAAVGLPLGRTPLERSVSTCRAPSMAAGNDVLVCRYWPAGNVWGQKAY